HTFTYDNLHRLVAALHSNVAVQPAESYSYDAIGNRISSQRSSTYSYSYAVAGAGNRLLADAQYAYDYDNEGNLVRRTAKSIGEAIEYSYDYRNRLVFAAKRDAQGMELAREDYQYDIWGRLARVARSDGASRRNVYDGLNAVLRLDQNGAAIAR